MRKSRFNLGDGVLLNSGSPVLLVVECEFDEFDYVTASWRDDGGEVHEVALPSYCFKPVKHLHWVAR